MACNQHLRLDIAHWVGRNLRVIPLVDTPYELSDFLPAVGVAIVLAALGSATGRAFTWRLRLRRNRLYAPQTFVISDSAFQILSSTGELTLPWTSILSIKRANERLFLFMTKYSAYIVPRRAFGSDAEFETFVSAAEERWKGVQR